MSANVWFEEINTSLVREIKNYVKITNDLGEVIAIDNVVIRKPEEDFKITSFPCVSIYNLSYNHSPERYNPNLIVLGKNDVKKTVEVEESAISFNLDYQIDFWSYYQTDMDRMTRTWLSKHFRQFNLDVVDDGGNKRNCNCITKGKIVKSDLLLNEKRLYHSIIKLEIWVEIDDEIRYDVPMVVTRDINTHQGG